MKIKARSNAEQNKFPCQQPRVHAPEHPPASAFWASGNACLNRKEIIDVLRCTSVRCNNARAPASAGLLCSVAVCVYADMEALQGFARAGVAREGPTQGFAALFG